MVLKQGINLHYYVNTDSSTNLSINIALNSTEKEKKNWIKADNWIV